MSIGYDTVNQALLGEFGLLLLGLILLFKLLTTSAGIGLGLPAGLIGPTLVIGAAAGGLMGGVFTIVTPNYEFSVGFYALMGMGAMMAATLNAPLAALIAMLELTGNPNIIFPGMLVVVAAVLTSSKVFKQESIFISLLKARGLDYRHDPIAQSLGNIGVASVMNTNFNKCQSSLTYVEAESLLDNNPHWLVVQEDLTTSTLLPGADLALYLKNTTIEETPEIDLMKIPATRLQLVSIDLRATLQEALDNIGKTNAEGCFVTQMTAPMINKTYGIITRSDIDSSYKYHS
jgi:CIC family chloride channel protein